MYKQDRFREIRRVGLCYSWTREEHWHSVHFHDPVSGTCISSRLKAQNKNFVLSIPLKRDYNDNTIPETLRLEIYAFGCKGNLWILTDKNYFFKDDFLTRLPGLKVFKQACCRLKCWLTYLQNETCNNIFTYSKVICKKKITKRFLNANFCFSDQNFDGWLIGMIDSSFRTQPQSTKRNRLNFVFFYSPCFVPWVM